MGANIHSHSPDGGREVGLRGRLEQFGLATVLTFLDLERRSGELLLLGARGVGRLWLHHGRVVRARIEGSRRMRKPAVYDLLDWNEGRFTFTQNIPDFEDEIGAPTPMLLIEAARRADEQLAEAQDR